MHLSHYLKVYPSQNRSGYFMLYSTIRGSIVQVSAETLREARAGSVPGPEGATLVRLGMMVADLESEKEQMRGTLERANG